jgi:hypothetical protein
MSSTSGRSSSVTRRSACDSASARLSVPGPEPTSISVRAPARSIRRDRGDERAGLGFHAQDEAAGHRGVGAELLPLRRSRLARANDVRQPAPLGVEVGVVAERIQHARRAGGVEQRARGGRQRVAGVGRLGQQRRRDQRVEQRLDQRRLGVRARGDLRSARRRAVRERGEDVHLHRRDQRGGLPVAGGERGQFVGVPVHPV